MSTFVRAVIPVYLLLSLAPFDFSNIIIFELEVKLDVYCPKLVSKCYLVALPSPCNFYRLSVLFFWTFCTFLGLSFTEAGWSLILSSVRFVFICGSLMSLDVRLLFRVDLYCTVFNGPSILSVKSDELKSIFESLCWAWIVLVLFVLRFGSVEWPCSRLRWGFLLVGCLNERE